MTTTTYRTMEDVRRANAGIGHHFFEPSTLRFFDSRIGRTLYGGRYFVTSEQYHDYRGGYSAPRLYTVREVLPGGRVETVGDFQQYASRSGANAAAKRLAQGTQ